MSKGVILNEQPFKPEERRCRNNAMCSARRGETRNGLDWAGWWMATWKDFDASGGDSYGQQDTRMA